MNTKLFSGPAGLPDFLRASMSSSMVELPSHLNPYHGDGVVVNALLPPVHSLKIIPAWYILDDAFKKGLLEDVDTLVENTSGNFGACLGFLAPYFGIEHVKLIVPNDLADGKLLTLLRHGHEVIPLTRSHPIGGIALAKEMGSKPGHFCPRQYENEANLLGHYHHTAPLVDELTEHKTRIVAIGFGSSATGGAFSRYGHENYENEYTVVGVHCAPKAEIPGARTPERLDQTGFKWRSFADTFVPVSTYNAYLISRILDLNGIPAGPSSGMAYWGLLNFLAKEKSEERLGKYRNKDGKIYTAVIFPDAAYNYWDKYRTILNFDDLGSNRTIPLPADYQI